MTASQYIDAAKLGWQVFCEVRKIIKEHKDAEAPKEYSLEWAAREIAKAQASKRGELP